MGGTSFNFFGGTDPLLGKDVGGYVEAMERMQAELETKKQQLLQMAKKEQEQPVQSQQQASNTPVWDEIDRIVGELSDKEFERVATDAEFVESQNTVMGIMQAVQLRMMRPMVEGTPEGKKALEEHLAVVKHLKKSIGKEVAEEMDEFKEYREHYSHLSWDEYQAQKGSKAKKGGKR